jgi:OOP family OmpA-OmpF porin
MKRVIILGLLAASVGAGAQQAESPVFDDRWYAGVTGGLARPGSERLTESTVPYFGASFGRFLSPDFSLDIQLDAYRPEFSREELLREADIVLNDQDLELYGLGLVGRYHFGEADDRHRFYGLAGLGIQEHQSVFDDGRDIYVSWGVGLRSELGRNLSLRTQLEGRYDNDRATFDRDHGFIDMIASVGLTFSFGEPPRPPDPAPEPEPVRAPPPPAPAPAPEPEPEPEVLFDFDATVLFAFDSAELRPEAQAELDRAADVLAPRDDIVLIEVAGHTDSIGTEAYNQGLSERRAQAVADYLAERGVDRDRMEVVGYGESRPRVPNDSPENRQKNRRVTISTIDD